MFTCIFQDSDGKVFLVGLQGGVGALEMKDLSFWNVLSMLSSQ